ncbi:MAG: hypothetical protein H7338_02890 [Candidatus Sericytochromatia bacterium]|nr:hypothetical protein [Candidatus Sericytochromatia bacterium]
MFVSQDRQQQQQPVTRGSQPSPGQKSQGGGNSQASGRQQSSSSYKQDSYSSSQTYQNKPNQSSNSQRDPVYQNKPSQSSHNQYQNDPVYQNKPSNQTYQNKPASKPSNNSTYQNYPSNSTYQNRPSNPTYQNNNYYNQPRITFQIGTVRDDVINASVNAMYASVGASGIRATDAASRVLDNNYDGYVSKAEMKDGLRYDRVALSLKNADNSYGRYYDAKEVADDVASRLDSSDGYRDGYVDMSVAGDFFENYDSWSGYTRGGISTSELSRRLASGDLVIGQSIRTRSNANNRGFTLAELHQNANGPKITIAQD